jgi:LuxR family maltose regulon positive regulatory protein
LLAELLYEQGELREAQVLVADYLNLAHGLGYVDKLIAGFMTKSRLEFLEAQYEAAQRTLDDAERYAATTGFERLRAHATAERLRQFLMLGRPDDAVDLAHRAGLLGSSLTHQPHGAVTTRDEIMAIAWSRAAFAKGELDAPIRLLKNWYSFTLERRCYRSSIRLAVELAKLLYARNDLSAACYHLCEALRYARVGRLGQIFLDGGEDVHEILSAASSGAAVMQPADREYAKDVLAAFGNAQRGFPIRRRGTVVEHSQAVELNRRERDILELAAGDVPNREIARRLALSENTVKWYWKRIFAKLAVSRRLQAVNSARAAGVIF